jgi:uncharacterized membrane protein YccC
MIALLLLVLACVLAFMAAFNLGQPRWSLGWLSLACYFLSLLFGNSGIGSHWR